MIRFDSLKAKLIIGTILAVLFSAGTVVSFSVYSLRIQALDVAQKQFHLLAHEEAASFGLEVSKALDTANTMAQVLGKVVDPNYPLDITRSEASELLRSILEVNEHFLGVFTVWEPDAYDGFDVGYANERGHDSSGRFAPYWSRTISTDVFISTMLECEFHCPGGEPGPWYSKPKESWQPFVHSPYLHQDFLHQSVMVVTISVPIVAYGKFWGVVGIDLDARQFQKLIETSVEYDDQLVISVVSDEQIYVADTEQPDRVGGKVDSGPALDFFAIKDQVPTHIEGDQFHAFAPISLDDVDLDWMVHVSVPMQQVTGSVIHIIWQQVFIFAGIMLLMVVVAYLLARRVIKPLSLLVDGVRRIDHGDLSQAVEINTRDEIGTLAAMFDRMRLNLQKTLAELREHQTELEDKVADRTLELEMKNSEIERNRHKLQLALDEISKLFVAISEKGEFGAYYQHPGLEKCWEVLECQETDCPCYGEEPRRCWQISGTKCQGKLQGDFTDKMSLCADCKLYQQTLSDPIYQIGEQFNNMMFVLEQNRDQLNEAYKKLKMSQATILQQEKMASIGQLAAGVAHEINNPIGFVKSNLSTMERYLQKLQLFMDMQSERLQTSCDEEQLSELKTQKKKLKIDYLLEDAKDLIDESIDGTERVRVIVQNLKSFSRVDQTEYKAININECIDETLNIIWNELKYKTTIHKEYGELPDTYCYPQQLNQVFMNILVNAAHAIEEKGDIYITTRATGEQIQILLRDTGKGIPQDVISRLFEPFFTTKDVGEGTGLGLSIVYEIIQKHDGEINVESTVGEGTTFTIGLPIVDQPPEEK